MGSVDIASGKKSTGKEFAVLIQSIVYPAMVKEKLVFVVLIFTFHGMFCLDLLEKFHQSDFKLRDLRTAVTYMNKSILHDFNLIGHKYNRTTTAFNFTIWPKFDLKANVEVIVQGYKRASNEYRLFPIRFQLNYCKGIQANILGSNSLAKCGNFSTCNWKKDNLYTAYNFVIDEKLLPPFLPHGEYMARSDYFFFKDKMASVDAFAEVYSAAVPKYRK